MWPLTQNPDPLGFSRPKYTFIRMTLQTQPICSRTLIMGNIQWYRIFIPELLGINIVLCTMWNVMILAPLEEQIAAELQLLDT